MTRTREKLQYLRENRRAPLSFFIIGTPGFYSADTIACEKCGDEHCHNPGQLLREEQRIEAMGGVVLALCVECARDEGVSATSTTPTLLGFLNTDGEITP